MLEQDFVRRSDLTIAFMMEPPTRPRRPKSCSRMGARRAWCRGRAARVRFYERADLGFHYQLTRVAGNFINLFEVGLDFYVW